MELGAAPPHGTQSENKDQDEKGPVYLPVFLFAEVRLPEVGDYREEDGGDDQSEDSGRRRFLPAR